MSDCGDIDDAEQQSSDGYVVDLPTHGKPVDMLERLKTVTGSEPVEPAVEPEVFQEPAVENAGARAARRQLTTSR